MDNFLLKHTSSSLLYWFFYLLLRIYYLSMVNTEIVKQEVYNSINLCKWFIPINKKYIPRIHFLFTYHIGFFFYVYITHTIILFCIHFYLFIFIGFACKMLRRRTLLCSSYSCLNFFFKNWGGGSTAIGGGFPWGTGGGTELWWLMRGFRRRQCGNVGKSLYSEKCG